MQRPEGDQQEDQRQKEAENGAMAVGPADALPAWRPFYAAVRDAMQRLREEVGPLNSGTQQNEPK
ncbi:hypothetical protein [Paenibacillus sp. MMS18-CY102]|uniref:hypothetical protein n=1 Tax=Paenibacillus sp. MMS18-CY102 TaxID=2682849 RepID=UPI0013662CE4|nr:hypothetical protein [Paenibacillus sp. MMS18-CY102]MWC28598.1 hypothetical protein [Paenibacillus sp. MMS18-CY102]